MSVPIRQDCQIMSALLLFSTDVGGSVLARAQC